MPRAFLVVLDSVGIGGAVDAVAFGDADPDTVGHIAAACARGEADRADLRRGPLRVPHLDTLGLGHACTLSTGRTPAGLTTNTLPRGLATCARETSLGKDTPCGHWELAGAPFAGQMHVFPDAHPSLPRDLAATIIREASVTGLLGDKWADGVGIIDEFGAAHVSTGKPIVYTSVDSVLQIAAHEETFGLRRLYDLCAIVRRLVDPLGVGRVIARPFAGASRDTFKRTPHRKDFSIPPPLGNVLDRAADVKRAIATLGKIGDIFGHRATGREAKAATNDDVFDLLLAETIQLEDGGLCVANLVDFDTDFGHRRDVAGYAAALEAFDRRLPKLLDGLREDDLLILTADHGNDPTAPGSNHTRENVPVLCVGAGLTGIVLPPRETFADVGQTIAAHLAIAPVAVGRSFCEHSSLRAQRSNPEAS